MLKRLIGGCAASSPSTWSVPRPSRVAVTLGEEHELYQQSQDDRSVPELEQLHVGFQFRFDATHLRRQARVEVGDFCSHLGLAGLELVRRDVIALPTAAARRASVRASAWAGVKSAAVSERATACVSNIEQFSHTTGGEWRPRRSLPVCRQRRRRARSVLYHRKGVVPIRSAEEPSVAVTDLQAGLMTRVSGFALPPKRRCNRPRFTLSIIFDRRPRDHLPVPDLHNALVYRLGRAGVEPQGNR